MEAQQYPIGRFQPEKETSQIIQTTHIDILERFPQKLSEQVRSLHDHHWETSYRPGGWTAIQVVNHLADSHMHSYARFKPALTEKKPTIKDYPEALWADLNEARQKDSITASLQMITGIHFRWVGVLKTMTSTDFEKSFYHPETQTHHRLHQALAYYSWHCGHHLGHLNLIENKA